ncbi:MAG: sigma-54 dependent transcriptional regulator [Vicinamibacteria bacterium]|nr:sigma-54 dependent transcriptional regulator [Vicinamibacteria bacterium]
MSRAPVFASAAMRELMAQALRVAAARSPVLLEGESGCGKDLLARYLHEHGERAAGPFVTLHCPSLSAELAESELFGHEKGAFTDARMAKPGRLEAAEGGTLYLDQVQDLEPTLQAKLLRVVEERRFERLGGTRTLSLDARIIASANVDLRQAVATGRFREDLFHRLAVVPLRLPPLRERREDVLPLALCFLDDLRGRGRTAARGFADDALVLLRGYSWPGNVRELRAAVERAVLYADGETIGAAALPGTLLEQPQTLWAGQSSRPTLKQLEQAYIRYVLQAEGGSQTRAAAVLGISRKALWEKRRRYGLDTGPADKEQ